MGTETAEATNKTRDEYASAIKTYLDGIAEHDNEAKEYLEEGSIRRVEPLPDEVIDHATQSIQDQGFERKQCYMNCQLAAISYPETYTYAEGYVLSNKTHIPIQHAWVERDGVVVELTLPGRPEPHETAAYFGLTYDTELVSEELLDREAAYPLAGPR